MLPFNPPRQVRLMRSVSEPGEGYLDARKKLNGMRLTSSFVWSLHIGMGKKGAAKGKTL